LVLLLATASPLMAMAADDPPPIRVQMVNDVTDEAMAGVRQYAQQQVKMCRAFTGLPDAPPPALPDAVLRKVVYYQDEELFRADRTELLKTTRTVTADASSHCEPYVWVSRFATLEMGCDLAYGGSSHLVAPMNAPGEPAMPDQSAKMDSHPIKAACPNPYKSYSAGSLPQIDAGLGAKCVWLSAVIWNGLDANTQAHMPQLNPGSDGSQPKTGSLGDVCIYAQRPDYRSSRITGKPVELKGNKNVKISPDTVGRYLAGNFHLATFSVGTAIPDSDISPDGMKAFLNLPFREQLPKS
jgi:hypothetical protein